MKKTILLLGLTLIMIMSYVSVAYADAAPYEIQQGGYYVYVATPDGGLNMRSGPGIEYEKVMSGRIPDGVRLYIGVVSGNWGQTSYNGYSGWVALKQTTVNPPKAPEPKVVAPNPQPETEVQVESQNEPEAPELVEEEPANVINETESEQEAFDGNENSDDVKAVKKSMMSQIILVAILLFVIILLVVVLIIVINSRK